MLFVYMINLESGLNAVKKKRQEEVNKTPDDYKNEKEQELYTRMVQAQKTEENASSNTAIAEENWKKQKYGARYQDVQLKTYVYQSQKLSADMLNSHKKQLQELDDKLKTYSSTITYSNNLEEVKQTLFNNIQELVKQIQGSTASLNNRTTYYTEKSYLYLSRLILVENVFLIAYLIIMFLDFKNVSHKELVIILFILFFSDLFLTLLHKIPNSITTYTQWGYDPIESKMPWFLTMFILVCFAGFLTYIQTINEFFTNLR